MSELFATLGSFLPNYAATLLLGALCAYLGVFTVLRRIVFTGAALAQGAASGVAMSFWIASFSLSPGLLTFFEGTGATLLGLLVSTLCALALARPSKRSRTTADAKVGIVFAVTSALAILFVWRSSAGLVELQNILAGDVLLSSSRDLGVLTLGALGVGALHLVLRGPFLLVSYDPEFARARGLRIAVLEGLFLISLAVSVSLALRAGGLMLVFGTLTLPPIAGLRVSPTLGRASWTAVALAWSCAWVGFLLAIQANLPVAPTIVACQGLALLVSSLPHAARWVEGAATLGAALALLTGLGLALTDEGQRALGARDLSGAAGGGAHDHTHEAVDRRQEVYADRITAIADPSVALDDRIQATRDLEQLGELRAIGPLIEASADPIPEFALAARRAAAALATGTGPSGVSIVLETSLDPEAELAALAAWVLFEMGHELGPPRLVEALGRDDVPFLLRDEIHLFLRELDPGSPEGYDAFLDAESNASALGAWDSWADSYVGPTPAGR